MSISTSLRLFARRPWLILQRGLQQRTPRNVLKYKHDRGMVQEIFPKESGHDFAAFLERQPRCVYAGFDPTAESLHIGNLLVIMSLLQCQRAGHKVIALIGGATARIGDPSGKSAERPVLPEEDVQKNIAGLRENLSRIFRHHEEHFCDGVASVQPAEIINNDDWYRTTNIVDFLGNVGRHLRMGRMLSRQSVRSRLDSEHGMSLTEFTYQAFQAYDWLRLCDTRGCDVQIGGSDQMGNIMAGYELISRVRDRPVFGLTLPLITSEEGEKLGKTAGTPVWLAEEKMTPFNFYQFFVRTPDSQIENLLKMFTFLSLGEISDIMASHTKQPEKRKAQERLAAELTLLVHGRENLTRAQRTTDIIYNGNIDAIAKMSADELRTQVFEQAPYRQLLFAPGMDLVEFAMKIGCFRTEKDARRIIEVGGFYVNMVRKRNPDEIVVPGVHILANSLSVVRVGKKNYYVVEWTM